MKWSLFKELKWSLGLIKELKWSLSLIKELKWSLMKEYCKTLETDETDVTSRIY